MTLDVSALIGAYPFREIPHSDPETLVRVLDREGIVEAWVGHLPTAFHRDPHYGNLALFQAIGNPPDRLYAAAVVRPDWPSWRTELARAVHEGARAIRAYPTHWGLGPESPALHELAAACAEDRLPLVLTVRFEDGRQRH